MIGAILSIALLGAPTPNGEEGKATWYGAECSTPHLGRTDTCSPYLSKKQGGRGGELVYYAAVANFRNYKHEPYPVVVCIKDQPWNCVRVIVRDYCERATKDAKKNPGSSKNLIIDLSPAAFVELAPLWRGILNVVVYPDHDWRRERNR